MGGKTWSQVEERCFWEVIVPQSPKRINPDHNPHVEWKDLAPVMQSLMGRDARRRYTWSMLFEHFFQNIATGHISPCARRFVTEYKRQREAHRAKVRQMVPHTNVTQPYNASTTARGTTRASIRARACRAKTVNSTPEAQAELPPSTPEYEQPPTEQPCEAPTTTLPATDTPYFHQDHSGDYPESQLSPDEAPDFGGNAFTRPRVFINTAHGISTDQARSRFHQGKAINSTPERQTTLPSSTLEYEQPSTAQLCEGPDYSQPLTDGTYFSDFQSGSYTESQFYSTEAPGFGERAFPETSFAAVDNHGQRRFHTANLNQEDNGQLGLSQLEPQLSTMQLGGPSYTRSGAIFKDVIYEPSAAKRRHLNSPSSDILPADATDVSARIPDEFDPAALG